MRLPTHLKLLVEMAERCELAGVLRIARGLQFAPRIEIAPAEQIGRRNHRRAHGAVLVGALRPGEPTVQPELEAHETIVRPSVVTSKPAIEGHFKTGQRTASRT